MLLCPEFSRKKSVSFWFCIVFLPFFTVASLAAEQTQGGIVASVNGEIIHLRHLQILIDSRANISGTTSALSPEAMIQQYNDALNTLIIYTLAQQELKKNHIMLDEQDILKKDNELLQEITFEEKNSDSLITPDEWKWLMRYHHTMLAFDKKILSPRIENSIDEIRNYYDKNKNAFHLPGYADICYLSSPSRKDLENYCSQGGADTPDISFNCFEADWASLQAHLEKSEFSALKQGKCSPVKQAGTMWESMLVQKQHEARLMALPEAFPIIEDALITQKKKQIYDAWLKKAVAQSIIRISPMFSASLFAKNKTGIQRKK